MPVKSRSGLEDKINEAIVRDGLDASYEEKVLETFVPWKYKADYVLKTSSGKSIIIEAKGDMRRFNSDYRKKWLCMYRTYKDKYDIRIVFQKDCKLPHSKTMTCSKWAEKHDIKYHIGEEIPKSWSEE